MKCVKATFAGLSAMQSIGCKHTTFGQQGNLEGSTELQVAADPIAAAPFAVAAGVGAEMEAADNYLEKWNLYHSIPPLYKLSNEHKMMKIRQLAVKLWP